MYECFNCREKMVVWDADYSFEEYCLEGEGIVHHLHCGNCGAEIDYYCATGDPETDDRELNDKDESNDEQATSEDNK